MNNRTELAILGLVADGPRSGYDIRKEVSDTLSHFWNESTGHVYPMLARLHKRGLLTRSTEASHSGRPPRHLYAITEDGLAELTQWLAEPIEPAPPRLEILLKVYFGVHAGVDVVIEHIERYKASRQLLLNILASVDKELTTPRPNARQTYLRLTVRAGIHSAKSAIAWCDEALEMLKAPLARRRGVVKDSKRKKPRKTYKP